MNDPQSVFAALAEPTRRDVLALVASLPGATASGLAERLTVSRQAVTKHLAVLVAAGLVVATRQGREVRHHVRAEPLRDTAAWLCARADAWDDRLDGLKSAAESADLRGGGDRGTP